MRCDLNGDGLEEDIEFIAESKHSSLPAWLDDFTIVINGDSTSRFASGLTGECLCVDIDPLDSFKELVVSEYGPSDDPAEYFFRYVDGELAELGKLPGRLNSDPASMLIDGSGEVQTRCRGQLLHTWYHPCKFRVGADHRFFPVPEDFYPMGVTLELLGRLSLLDKPGGRNVSAVVGPGAKITVVGSDDVRWCLAKTEDGVQGWFELVDFSRLADGRLVFEVFNGLCIAD